VESLLHTSFYVQFYRFLAEREELQKQPPTDKQQQDYQDAINKAYHDAYIQDLKNRGYKIRYKKTFKDYIRIFITFLVIIAIAFIAWQIPFIRNWFLNLYYDNEIIQSFVNILKQR
jgi:hypothetical protein